MSIYDINYNNAGNLLLPPSKRKPKYQGIINTIMKPMQWLRDLILGDYKEGSAYAFYNNSIVYAAGDRVVWYNRGVYERLPVNLGISGAPPTSSIIIPNYDPTLFWMKVQDNFIGTDERVRYNGQIIIFEAAINKWFFNPLPNDQIYVGPSVNPTPTNYAINVPLALFNSLGANNTERENVIRSFADVYNVIGMIYEVLTY